MIRDPYARQGINDPHFYPMLFYRPPRNDLARRTTLSQITETGASHHAAGLHYLSQETFEAIQTLLPAFDAALHRVTSERTAYLRAAREGREALSRLKDYLRDLWEVTRRRVRRHGEPAFVLGCYQLSANGSPPRVGSYGEWLLMADRVIAGEAQAIAQGYPPAVCPSVAEIQAVLTVAQNQQVVITMADRKYDEAQAALATLRSQADALIHDAMEELRFALRKLDAPSQRRIMRFYGATFVSRRGKGAGEEEGEPAQADL
ncbi:MAG: hypothetical protein H6636_07180 [Anaerolineales bacterium]|nr:hypothetical protein [Anaerolineales bacterium]